MIFPGDKLREISTYLDNILTRIQEYETLYQKEIKGVHPRYTESARNLIHYLALRSMEIDLFQNKLSEIGLPYTGLTQSKILHSLQSYKTIVNHLIQEPQNDFPVSLGPKEAKKIAKSNAKTLFGPKKNNRKTAIMVTQPTLAAEDPSFTSTLLKSGMNCARINCAHDDPTVWKQIITQIKMQDPSCKIMMDLGGPKLRTGKMKPGHKVIHIKPQRNTLGQVTTPARVWLAPYGSMPPEGEVADAIIPVNKKWLKKTRTGSFLIFKDSRAKKCKITIEAKEGSGRWGSCSDSAYITTGTLLNVFLEKKSTSEIHTVHELLPLEEIIFLHVGDELRIDRAPILGEPAKRQSDGTITKIAHISCTLPQIFDCIKADERIYFDDGKIEGVIQDVQADHLIVRITNAKKKGGKLKADKGINLPDSELDIRGLTDKDRQDLIFVAKHADAVNFSFVTNKKDVEELLEALKDLKAEIGIILKIETKEAFNNLPGILLKAMENYPVGLMIARGDLAIETGWKNVAIIQEEILHLCEAAHLPDIWATQVLENLAKKGIPTRAEITDAAMAQRAACVMLNKGPYIEKAVRMLDKILRRMEKIQKKQRALLPKLEFKI